MEIEMDCQSLEHPTSDQMIAEELEQLGSDQNSLDLWGLDLLLNYF